jgi:hypothetical protein
MVIAGLAQPRISIRQIEQKAGVRHSQKKTQDLEGGECHPSLACISAVPPRRYNTRVAKNPQTAAKISQ